MVHIYNPENFSIKPFIVMPLPEHQDTIILGSKELAQPDFKHELFSRVGNDPVDTIHICGFRYSLLPNEFIISISFPSSIPEAKSNRLGQVFTIGASFKKHLFNQNYNISLFCIYMIEAFNSIFNLNLFENGSDVFIVAYPDKNNAEKKLEKLIEFYLAVTNLFYLLPNQEAINKKIKNFLTSMNFAEEFKPINIILCKKDINIKNYIELVLYYLNDILSRETTKNIDFSCGHLEKNEHFKIVQCLPNDFQANSNNISIDLVNGNQIITIK